MLYYQPDLRGTITPDSMKDAVMGENYANKGTDAAWFVDFVAKYGLKLYKVEGIPGHLVDLAHQLIQNGKPAIFTEIDPYVDTSLPQYAGWTHVCSWYKEFASGLVAMDPFGGKLIDESNAYWTQKIVGNELWTVERMEETVIIDLNNPEVAKYFELANAAGTQWRCRSNGKIIQFGMLDTYKKYGNSALCGLTYLGLCLSNEIPLQGVPGAVKQFFERGVLIYDPKHQNDNPPGAGSVYPAHLYEGTAQDPRIADLQAKLATAPNSVMLQQQLDVALARLDKVKADVG